VAEATRDLEATLGALEETYRSTLEALGSAIDTRDLGTQAHSRRVRGYSLAVARAHGMTTEADLRVLEHGVLLHDIGKIGIPDAILLKPGPLTPAEWKIMRTHPEIGRQLVEQIAFLRPAVPIVYHHERWDGTGCRSPPRAVLARASAADAFDAMTFDRPHSRLSRWSRAGDRALGGQPLDPGSSRRSGPASKCSRRTATVGRITRSVTACRCGLPRRLG
jgi:HD-GYP domain-containing protein (c-di-GMP phosphodiesterase class II)